MASETVVQTSKRDSTVVPSKVSSEHSLCSGDESEAGQIAIMDKPSVAKAKSSSLSCLPDRIHFLDNVSYTLPPSLSSVKPVGGNLAEGISVNVWHDTVGSLSSSSEHCSEEDGETKNVDEIKTHGDAGEDQEPSSDNNNVDDKCKSPNQSEEAPKLQQEIDLSELNTETRTYVRTSALDILAAFPKTETVLSNERKKHSSRSPEKAGGQFEALNEVSEGIHGEIGNSSTVSPSRHAQPAKSEPVLGGSSTKQPEVISWSSANDVDLAPKKKRLLHKGKKKMVYEISDSLNSQSSHEDEKCVFVDGKVEGRNSTDSGSEQKQKKKKKKKRTERREKRKSTPSALLYFFRGKSESKENGPKQEKTTKARKPVQKSLSFHSGTNTTPRNSDLNRMDSFRKLFKRQRDAASTSATFGDGKHPQTMKCLEISSPIMKSEFRSNNLVDREVFMAHRERAHQLDKDVRKQERTGQACDSAITVNAVSGEDAGDPQETPVPPVRWKHLERKGLSRTLGETDDVFVGDDSKQSSPSVQSGRDFDTPQDSDASTKINNRTETENSELKGDGHLTDLVIAIQSLACQESDKSAPESDLERTTLNSNPNQSVVKHNENESGITHDPSPPGNIPVDKSSPCLSPSGTKGGVSEETFEEVFEECVAADEQSSLDSASAGANENMEASMPTNLPRRWQSDVTSGTSKKLNGSAKKAASFSGGKPTSNDNSFIPLSSKTGDEKPQRRSMSIFGRIPSVRLEQTEAPTMVTDLVPTSFPTISTDRRSQIVLELFTTERTYVRGLETMIELFQKPLLACKVDEKEVDALFSNINDIFAVNKDLLFLLWEKVRHWRHDQCIGQIFVDVEDRLKIYSIYCKNFDTADAMFKQKLKRNKDFDRFLKACYQDPLCQPGLDLPAYLITIVQRIPRYLLLLKDLCKKTPSSHPDYDNLKQALSRMNKVAEYINSQLQEVHGKKAMQELRSTVIGLKAYEVKGRTLLKEGEVCLMSPKKPYKCLLFNDIMVFAVQGSKDRSEIEMTLELRTLWFEDLKKQDPQTGKCDAIELYTPHRPYTMYACSRAEKRVWLQKLRTAIVTLLYGPDCEDPESMDISRRKASDTYIDGSVYCGGYVNGKRHGEGVMAWPNRTRYEGSWADDERHGHGQLTYYTGEKYVGSWVADKKDGEGKQTYTNGDVYQGQWSEGKMHGKGVIDFSNGDRFVGDMFNNEVEGNGEMTCVSGLAYKGQWKTSKRHGQGHVFFPNGNEYKGEMLNDRICGYGQMNYVNGDEYVGEWVNEMRHGIGNYKLVTKAVYSGQWNNDFMNGQGKMSYPNGDEYSGTWFQNKRVGKGQLVYAHGDTYNGQWQDDSMHGKGTMYYKDGSVYEGTWERGERHGNGKTVYCDKSLYEGEYFNGFRQGRGKLIYSNNVCYVGEWKADKFDGQGVFSDPNTEYSYQGDWCCGKREGSGIEICYRTRFEGSWKADMKHGAGTETSHARHRFEGTWKENRKHGRGVRTLRSGVREEQTWHEGHLIDTADTVAEDLPPLPRR